MISAKTRSADADTMGAGLAPPEIDHIVHNHIFISNVGPDAIGRMNTFVVKTVEVERVRAINRDAVVIDKPRDRIDYAEVLVLVVTAKGGWKNNQGQPAAATEDEHFEFAAQVRRPPFNVTLHRSGRPL